MAEAASRARASAKTAKTKDGSSAMTLGSDSLRLDPRLASATVNKWAEAVPKTPLSEIDMLIEPL